MLNSSQSSNSFVTLSGGTFSLSVIGSYNTQDKNISIAIPANSQGKYLALRYYDNNSNQIHEYRYFLTQKPTTPVTIVPNDNYTEAINLTVSSSTTCTSIISGTTVKATQSSQSEPSCEGGIDDDVWYKFVATSNIHTVNLSNIVGDGYGATSASMAIYNSGLNQIECAKNQNAITSNELVIGQTYYVRVWTTQGWSKKSMTFNICVTTPSKNVIKSLEFTGWTNGGKTFVANFIHDSSIPLSDIAVEWGLSQAQYFPYSPTAFDFSILSPTSMVLYAYDVDYYINIKARLKQVSSGLYISDWYITPSPIFSWYFEEEDY